MFEAIELNQKITKKEFQKIEPELRTNLLRAQYEVLDTDIPVLIIISGVEGAGKSEVVNRLNEWLDARWIRNHAFWRETEEMRLHPRYWRFWKALPAKGRFAVMFGSWYTQPIIDRAMNKIDQAALDQEIKRIEEVERMLSDGNTLIVKFWFHLSKETSFERIQKKETIKSPLQKKFFKKYDKFVKICEQALKTTDTPHAPWHLVEATDVRYRDITVGRVLLNAMQAKLQEQKKKAEKVTIVTSQLETHKTVLDNVRLDQTLTDKEYKKQLDKYQKRLKDLSWKAYNAERSLVAVFEGWDAAGKGSAIRRVTASIDARLFNVISVAAPTDEEKAHHYFWRFWRYLPLDGYITIYDRSWYGRVLVERVEGFANQEEWSRSYNEINDFEEEMTEHGLVLIKFWLHISKDEQLRRFKEREVTPWKQHKITEEDWRNREKWEEYEMAVNEMVARTSTAKAPWVLVPGNDKKVARVTVIKSICDALKAAL